VQASECRSRISDLCLKKEISQVEFAGSRKSIDKRSTPCQNVTVVNSN